MSAAARTPQGPGPLRAAGAPRHLGYDETAIVASFCAARPHDGRPVTVAIGDVHGETASLLALLGTIARHCREEGLSWTLVFLGDLVDRGADAAGTLEAVRLIERLEPGNTIVLMGNHEEALLHSKNGGNDWAHHHGLPTLRSFSPTARTVADLPDDVVEWISARPLHHADARRRYVHAGLVPGAPFERQNDIVMLHIREGFADRDEPCDRHVVHGHTPTARGGAEALRHRTNLDGGCARGGFLVAGVFDDSRDGPIAVIDEYGRVSACGDEG